MPRVRLRILFGFAWVCIAFAFLFFVGDFREVTYGPVEIGSWSIQAIQGDAFLSRGHSIIGKTPLASLAVPLTFPLVGWIVLAARQSVRRRGFPVEGQKVDA